MERDTQRRAKAAHVWDAADGQWYVEPEWATALLLRHERFVGTTWDPSCGGGNTCRAMMASGVPALGTDIVRRAPGADPWWLGERDFLADDIWLEGAVNALFNPPFFRAKGTEAFIRKALRHAPGKVACFADVKFLASQGRAEGLFAEHCPHRVWTHARRPSCPPGEYLAAGNEAKGGTADWCWMVWDQTAPKVTMYQGGWLRGEVVEAAA